MWGFPPSVPTSIRPALVRTLMPTLTDEQLFDRLIAMPTVSKDSNLDFIDFLSEYGEESGARVERDANDLGTKENLI